MDMKLIERGQVNGGKIILPQPLAIPDGTDAVVRVETVAPGGARSKARPAASAPRASKKPVAPQARRPFLNRQEVRRYAKEHPAPAEWWNAIDSPFEP
jgi:hypothetical protein